MAVFFLFLFLSQEQASPGKFVLKPIDHGHILACGRELTPKVAQISAVREETLYGLFPMFKPYLKVDDFDPILAELASVNEDMWKDLLSKVPDEWGVSDPVRRAIGEFLHQRARFLAGTMKRWVQAQIEQEKGTFYFIKKVECPLFPFQSSSRIMARYRS